MEESLIQERLLVADNLSCHYGARRLFEKKSVSLPAGGRLYVQGANGAGKTSLLRILAGILKPSAGAVLGRAPMHYIAHENGFAPSLTVDEILAFWANLLGGRAEKKHLERAKDFAALRAFAKMPASRLSAGQKRRLALSRLFLDARPLWLLDEADQSLDKKSSARFEEAVFEHCQKGGGVVMAGHIAQDALEDAQTLALDETL